MAEQAKTAQRAYGLISLFLFDKPEKTAGAALKKYGKQLEKLVGDKYSPSVSLIVDAFYNMDKYAPDGVPMDELYDMIDDIAD